MDEDRDLLLGLNSIGLSRRTVLRGGFLGGVGLAAAALIGCGDDDDDDDDDGGGGTASPTATATETATPTETAMATEEPSDGGITGTEPLMTPAGNTAYQTFEDPPGEPKAGNTFVQAVQWAIGPMDPYVSPAGGSIAPGRAAYNRVVGFISGPDAKPLSIEVGPELASSWEISEDGLTYTFHLNDGIKWQNVDPLNGRDFTSDDVKFAWDRYASGGAEAGYWTNMNEITTPDPLTVEVTLNSPQPDFIYPLASRYLTIHPHEIVDDGTIEQRAIGTGPMIQTEVTPGERVLFEKNPDYFGGDVLLDGLEHRIMPDKQARVAAFRVGQVDQSLILTSGVAEVDAIIETNPDVIVDWSPVTYATFAWSFDLNDPRFADVRVRRALSLAVDRDLIVDLASDGYGAVVPAMPWIFLFDEQPTADSGVLGDYFVLNTDEASKMLQAAGQDGLEFDMLQANYGSNVQQNEIFVENMRDVGVTVNLNTVDYTEFNSQWAGKTFSDVCDGWGANGFDRDNFFYNQLYSEAPGNRYYLADSEIDEWALEQRITTDPDARAEILRKIWDKMLDQVYRIDKESGIGFEIYQPWNRYLRWTGPILANYSYTELGAMADKTWLAK